MANELSVEQAWDPIDYNKDTQNPAQSSATIYYFVHDTDSDAAVLNAVQTAAASTFEGIPLQSITIDERMTETWWKVAVKYGFAQNSGSGGGSEPETQYSFDVSAGTRHIVKSFAQITKLPSSAPDSGGINDGEGVDITCPVCTIAETHFLSPSTVTDSWRRTVAMAVGTINDRVFRGYQAGELLFTGCSGSRSGTGSGDKWQITFQFAVQPNQTNIPFGSNHYNKRGWDLAWFRYKEQEQTNGDKKIIVRTPVAVYVEQVYSDANFASVLGI